jgi:hypothetical protein
MTPACSCCERRLGHTPDSCACGTEYCPNCLFCKGHCHCTDEATIIDELTRSAGTPVSGAGARDEPQPH